MRRGSPGRRAARRACATWPSVSLSLGAQTRGWSSDGWPAAPVDKVCCDEHATSRLVVTGAALRRLPAGSGRRCAECALVWRHVGAGGTAPPLVDEATTRSNRCPTHPLACGQARARRDDLWTATVEPAEGRRAWQSEQADPRDRGAGGPASSFSASVSHRAREPPSARPACVRLASCRPARLNRQQLGAHQTAGQSEPPHSAGRRFCAAASAAGQADGGSRWTMLPFTASAPPRKGRQSSNPHTPRRQDRCSRLLSPRWTPQANRRAVTRRRHTDPRRIPARSFWTRGTLAAFQRRASC